MAEKLSVSIDSVLCRLEVKDLDVPEHLEDFFECFIQGMKHQMCMTNAQMLMAKKPVMNEREFGLLLVRAGLLAMAYHDEENQKETDSGQET